MDIYMYGYKFFHVHDFLRLPFRFTTIVQRAQPKHKIVQRSPKHTCTCTCNIFILFQKCLKFSKDCNSLNFQGRSEKTSKGAKVSAFIKKLSTCIFFYGVEK